MTTPVIGYDTTRPEMIPANAAAVFPYADGRYRWSHVRFPNALYRYITVYGEPEADIADFEEFAVYPAPALVTWAQRRLALGHTDITVYTDRANFPLVRAAMEAAEIDWHLFLTVGTDTVLTDYEGMAVRACQQFGTGADKDTVFEPGWLNRP